MLVVSSRNVIRVLILISLICIGGWLLKQQTSQLTESATRQAALIGLASPGNIQTDVNLSTYQENESVEPITVALGDIPQQVYDPENQLDRWMRGEIDLEESEGVLPEWETLQLRQAAMKLAPQDNVQNPNPTAIQRRSPLSTQVTVGSSFDSLDYTECCGGGGSTPPDIQIAAGDDHLIVVANVALEVYDKLGNSLVGPTTLSSFFASDSNCTGLFDPNVVYDEDAKRFMVGIDANFTHYCMAVSQTDDPTGSWHVYSFATNVGGTLFDFPHAGVGHDAIYVTGNLFYGSTGAFAESRAWAFNKAELYAGSATTPVHHAFEDGAINDGVPMPLHLHGKSDGTWPTSGAHKFIAARNMGVGQYVIYSWDDPFGTNTFSAGNLVDLDSASGVSAGFPINAPQQTGDTLQANDPRPLDFEYRDGAAWTSMPVSCNPGAGTVDCIRWAEIDLATETVTQTGVMGSDAEYRTFPNLAVNSCGDMMVAYTKTSTSMYPGIYYTGRESADTLNTLQTEGMLKEGEIEYMSFESSGSLRWGDYTGMTIDPDGKTFWSAGEYSKDTGTTNGRWGVYVNQLTFDDCSPDEVINTITITSNSPKPKGEAITFTATVNEEIAAPLVLDLSDGTSAPTFITYTWDFGDGTTVETTSNSVSHAYVDDDTYTVSVLASNGLGSATESGQVVVTAAPSNIILQNAAASQQSTFNMLIVLLFAMLFFSTLMGVGLIRIR